jgi:hypothetical protein
MSHRALQILSAAAALVVDDMHSVSEHRKRSHSEDEQELPATVVRLGEDQPIDEDGASSFGILDSVLALEFEHLVKADDEGAAIVKLLELRTLTHQKMLAGARDLGLPDFVIDVKYGGAGEPTIDVQTDSSIGSLVSRFLVHYRMNITDPS